MLFKQPKPVPLTYSGAEALAAEAMAFITSDPQRLTRFLADTGMDPQQLAGSLASDGGGILSAAMDHLVSDESLLMVFASEIRRKPEEIMHAHALLQGPAPLTSM